MIADDALARVFLLSTPDTRPTKFDALIPFKNLLFFFYQARVTGNFISFSSIWITTCSDKLIRHESSSFPKKRDFRSIVADTRSWMKRYWEFVTIFRDYRKMRLFHTNIWYIICSSLTTYRWYTSRRRIFVIFPNFRKKVLTFMNFFWDVDASNLKRFGNHFCWKYDAEHFFSGIFFDNKAYSRRYKPKTDFGGL